MFLIGFFTKHLCHFDQCLATTQKLSCIICISAKKDQVIKCVFYIFRMSFRDTIVVKIEFQQRFQAELKGFPICFKKFDIPGEFYVT